MLMLLRVLLVAAIAAVVYWYYGLVLPAVVAGVVAVAVGLVALFGLVSSQMRFYSWVFGGAVFAAWPAGALLAGYVAGLVGVALTETQALAWAWVAALGAAKATYAMSEKRDKARDLGGIALGVIAVYGVGAAAWHSDHWALFAASLGAAAIAVNARQSLILPPRQEQFLGVVALVAVSASVLHLGRAALGV